MQAISSVANSVGSRRPMRLTHVGKASSKQMTKKQNRNNNNRQIWQMRVMGFTGGIGTDIKAGEDSSLAISRTLSAIEVLLDSTSSCCDFSDLLSVWGLLKSIPNLSSTGEVVSEGSSSSFGGDCTGLHSAWALI